MSGEVRTLCLTAIIGAVVTPVLMWISRKMNIGKKETREEIEGRNFGNK